MTKHIAQTYNVVHENKMGIVRTMMFACLVVTLLYAFNLYRVISQTVVLEKVNSQISDLDNTVSALDAKYLELSSTITPDTVRQYGFSQAKVSMYITKKTLTAEKSNDSRSLAVGGYEF